MMDEMEPWEQADPAILRSIEYVLTDVDDTLTTDGRLFGMTIDALDRLHAAGVRIIPVTAASAGWCNLMIHMLPIDAVIAENGGLYFFRAADGSIRKHGWAEDGHRQSIEALRRHLMEVFPALELADDMPYRETSLAFRRGGEDIDQAVVDLTHRLGAKATVNSLWIICWIANYDKLVMAYRMFEELYGIESAQLKERILYVGDSQNDEPMFNFFHHAVGVASVVEHPLRHWPRWVCKSRGGGGFIEVAERLLEAR
ncbi:mannosyl-3-phosphoglycerate phosphatase [mine drainage metagenome]|uniref:Mannosyl-3-phosphoglycerate phosphatase n=1 Tax=mine drainage metagenome TaxID=410659 RepID=A0A1J5R8U8_9ZZZZ